MLATIFGGIAGLSSFFKGLFGSIDHVTDAISNEKIAVINAKTQEEQISAQERVNSLTLRRDVMIAEAATSSLNVRMRFMLALGPCYILLKIFIWDKGIGPFFGCVGKLTGEAAQACLRFQTDSLDPNLWGVVMAVLGFYFLCEGGITIAKVFKGAGK